MRHPRAARSWLIVVVLAVSAACSASADTGLVTSTARRVPADPALAQDAAKAINAFGIDLYKRSRPDGNLVFSPASIAIALGMTRPGAVGATAAEMDTVLHELTTDQHAGWLNAVDAALASRTGTYKDTAGEDQPVTLRIANAPFSQIGMKLEDAYLQALAERFGAGVRPVDYQHATEAARQEINKWVSDQTEQRIPELLAQGLLTDRVRLTLVNAIYLKAAWQGPFPIEATGQGRFTLADGSTIEVPMMRTAGSYRYASGDGWQAVELPYVGGSLAMTVIVPDDLATFESELSSNRLDVITGRLEERPVNLTLPKFSLETRLDLMEVLTTMGMPTAFDLGAADFSEITAEERLFIAGVIHQANIDVDEKGTTAAAATAVTLFTVGAPVDPVTVTVDRPFLFALRDIPTGTVIFLGRVAHPSATP